MVSDNKDAAQRLAVQKKISQSRRMAGSKSFWVFAQAYLPAYFKDPPSVMHLELFEMLQTAVDDRGARLAVAAPRGHAKSTIVSQAYVLWCICYGREPYILLISNTVDQASDCLSQIKNELQSNPRILEDFPEVAEVDPERSTAPRWRKEEIITRNDVKVTALGSDKKIRGRKHRQHRPTLIILDDVENEVEVRSAEQRQQKMEWFNKAVLKCGTAVTNVIVVGTILHYDSLLCRLITPQQSPGWVGKKYQAIMKWSEHPELWAKWELIYGHAEEHEGASGPRAALRFFEANRDQMLESSLVLWPQRESYYQLMVLRSSEGRASFDSEKQNEPINPEDCYFRESDFVFWDDQFETAEELLSVLGENALVFGGCDPSMGKAGRNGDDSAIITLVQHSETKVLYVLDADIRRRKPDAIIEDVIAYHRVRGYHRLGFEANQFQEFLKDELQRRSALAGQYLPIEGLKHTSDKLGRIQKLQPLITSGMLRLSRRHVLLLEQLRQFPMGAHDDGPDALEMAVAAATYPAFSFDIRDPNMDEPYDPLDDDRMWTTFNVEDCRS